MAKAKPNDRHKASARQSMADKMRERAANRESSGRGGMKFIFPEKQEIRFIKIEKAGTRRFDFIPYEITAKNHPAGVEVGDLWYQRTIWVHNGIGPEEKAYLCLKTVGKKCPICEYKAMLAKKANADEELIKALTSKEREVFQVIDLDDKDDSVQLWEYSYHLFGKKLEEEIREGSEAGDDYKAGFADLEGGSTLKIRFAKKTMGKNEFFETSRIDFEERDDYDESILDEVLDLDDILNILEYDKLEAIFLQTDPEDDDKPTKGRSRGRGKEKEEDEEPEEKPARGRGRGKEKEEEEEAEEPPARGRRGKKVEEEEPEEKPARSGRSGRGKEKEEEAPTRGRGRGKKEEEEELEEKPSRRGKAKEEEEKPKRGAKGKKEEPELAEDECPANEDGFGVDEGEHDECFECPNWDACKEICDEAKAAKEKKSGRGRR